MIGDADGGSPRSTMVCRWVQNTVHEKRVVRVETTRPTSLLIVRETQSCERKGCVCVCVHTRMCAHMKWERCA